MSLLAHRYDGVIRWGAQYQSRPYDPMHFEINAGETAVNNLAAKLLGDTRPKPPTSEEEVTMFIIGRADEAEQYLSDGFKRKWIPDAKHRDDYLALGVKITRNFNTEAGLNVVGGTHDFNGVAGKLLVRSLHQKNTNRLRFVLTR